MIQLEVPALAGGLSHDGSQGGTSERFSRIDFRGVRVTRCASPAEWEAAERLRTQAFGRLTARGSRTPAPQGLDAVDRAPGTQVLLGHARDGEPIASLRVQSGREGPLELCAHVPLSEICPSPLQEVAQFSRLAALRHDEALNVMFGLFKAAWRWCFDAGFEQIVIASPPWTRPIYEHLCFEDAGERGQFRHPFSSRAVHSTMCLDVQGVQRIWRARHHPQCALFFEHEHPDLVFQPNPATTAPRAGVNCTWTLS